MPAISNTPNEKTKQLKAWTTPSMQVSRIAEARLDLSLQNFDGILFQAS